MTENILRKLADSAKIRVQDSKKIVSLTEMMKSANSMGNDTGFPFEAALKKEGVSFICECKRASPSKGMIAEDLPYLQIAKEYEAAGADAISVLTEPTMFLGERRYLKEISDSVSIPCLRKDFIVDEYMVYESKTLGASAILLICSILTPDELRRFIRIAHGLGMSALCEAHNATEIRTAVDCGARIIGVNNRDLKDFSVNPNNCLALRNSVPQGILFVAESGIKGYSDVKSLEDAKVDAVLVGETMMRSKDKKMMLNQLRGIE